MIFAQEALTNGELVAIVIIILAFLAFMAWVLR